MKSLHSHENPKALLKQVREGLLGAGNQDVCMVSTSVSPDHVPGQNDQMPGPGLGRPQAALGRKRARPGLRVAPGACAATSPCTCPPIPPVPTDLPNYKGNKQQHHRGETSPSPSTFTSRGCREQRPHTGATGADPAGSLRSRRGQGLAPSAAPGEGPSCFSQLLGAPGGLGLWPCYSSLRFLLHTAISSCVSVQISLLLEDTSHCI